MEIKGHCIVPGQIRGMTILSQTPISFLGDIDPKTGIIIAKQHPLKNQCVTNKIFVFPCGKGSTVGSYIIYQLYKNNKAPLGIINQEAEAIVAVGAIISNIPMIHHVDISKISNGQLIEVDCAKGIIKLC